MAARKKTTANKAATDPLDNLTPAPKKGSVAFPKGRRRRSTKTEPALPAPDMVDAVTEIDEKSAASDDPMKPILDHISLLSGELVAVINVLKRTASDESRMFNAGEGTRLCKRLSAQFSEVTKSLK